MATDWTAAVAKMRALVGVYRAALAKAPLSLRQTRALATDLETLDADLAALATSLASPAAASPAAPVTAPVASDPYLGQPALEGDALLAFGQAHAAEIDQAYWRYLDVADAWLVANNEPAGRDGALRGALPRATSIDLAASVNASILVVAGYFGPEPAAGVKA